MMPRSPFLPTVALFVAWAATASAQQQDRQGQEGPGNARQTTAPKVPLNKVPEVAVRAAQERHPDLDILWAKKEDLNGMASYRFKFRDSAGDCYVGITADGKLLYTEQKTKEADLPARVRASLENEFLGARTKDIRVRTSADGVVTYRLDVGQGKSKDRAHLDGTGAVVGLRTGAGGGVEARLGRFFTGRGFEEKNWEAWLAAAVTATKMSDDQQIKAKALLEQAKEAVSAYRKAREADYKRIAADLARIRTDGTVAKDQRAGVEKAAAELAAPVDDIGRKWKADVLALLTPEQRRLAPR